MRRIISATAVGALGLALAATLGATRAAAQDPILTPIIIDTAVPIVVAALTPKPKPTGTAKFQGYVMHANIAQVTVRAEGNDLAVQTFALDDKTAAKMQDIIDKGGYQYGDKVTVYYDAQSMKAVRIKGRPSKPI
jgi:hypothetical protein